MAKVSDASQPAVDSQSLESTIYDVAPPTDPSHDPFYDEVRVVRSGVWAEVVACKARALKSLNPIPGDTEDADCQTESWPIILGAVARLSQLARSKEKTAGPDQVVAREALAATLAELAHATSIRNHYYNTPIYDNIVTIINAFDIAYQPMQSTDPAPPTTVASLLDNLRPLEEVRDHLRKQVASSAQDLIAPLNKWIKIQTAATFSEKEKTCCFINDLLSISGLSATFDKTPCYFRISKRRSYPEGVIYVMPFGSDRQLISRNQFADLPDIEVTPGPDAASEPGQNDWVSRAATSLRGKRNR